MTTFTSPASGVIAARQDAAVELGRPARFTVDGDDRLEAHLAHTGERIAAGIRGLIPSCRLAGVVLGGGYGRGEGGVLREGERHLPYNDLELYVFVHGSRHLNELRYGRALHVLAEILTPQAGVEVEFRVASLAELARSGVTMFTYDLVSAHRWLIGDDSLLASSTHHLEGGDIPLHEATRLLMNRCTGLLLAKERLARTAFGPADADFVARNIAKAQLAMGDAILAAAGEYHWSARERRRRFERRLRVEPSGWFGEVARHHARGVEFKLHPTRSSGTRQDLSVLHEEVSDVCRGVWLWVENRRLGARFRSVREYTECVRDKCPETSRARNLLVNTRWLGARAVRHLPWRHPRERVLNALATLLWRRDALVLPGTLGRLQRELDTAATDLPGMIAAYRSLWERVN